MVGISTTTSLADLLEQRIALARAAEALDRDGHHYAAKDTRAVLRMLESFETTALAARKAMGQVWRSFERRNAQPTVYDKTLMVYEARRAKEEKK